MNRHSHNSCGCKQSPCGCCAGIEALTPLPVMNRPGLDALAYRVGTHATFLETMKARLSSLYLDSDKESRKGEWNYPLSYLTTRAADDPTIAMLDAWATVADVLTFYQERIANEGYLRTATERRSILELARLVGYKLRPGVAATTYLALTLETGHEVVIEPFRLRAQSVPGPGELPQTFENVQQLDVRAQWNSLQPRRTQPQDTNILESQAKTSEGAKLYLKGIATGLSKNDPLLIVINEPGLYRVIDVIPEAAANRTLVIIKPWRQENSEVVRARLREIIPPFRGARARAANLALNLLRAGLRADQSDVGLADFIERDTLPRLQHAADHPDVTPELKNQIENSANDITQAARALRNTPARLAAVEMRANEDVSSGELTNLVAGLTESASKPPANALRLKRNVRQAFAARSDLGLQAFGAFCPQLQKPLALALAKTRATKATTMEVYALRVKAAPFGNNALPKLETTETTSTGDNPQTTRVTFSEWTAADISRTEETFPDPDAGPSSPDPDLLSNIIYLDASHDKILPDSWVVVDTSAIDASSLEFVSAPHSPLFIVKASNLQANISRTAYGISGKATRLELGLPSTNKKDAAWIKIKPIRTGGDLPPAADFQLIQRTAVYTQSERLDLAEEPIEDPVRDGATDPIVLDGVYSDLKSGRWLIVSGERDDLVDDAGNKVRGVKSSELVMLAEVVHLSDVLPGGATHTQIKLAKGLAYSYKRDTVTIYANVVKSTHGETRNEVLGSGDGSKALQQFALRCREYAQNFRQRCAVA
jgi:hypothetical protein